MSVAATASAPGKLVLFWEHSEAKHWLQQPQPVVCASLSDVRVNVRVESRSDGKIVVDIPDIVFSHCRGGEASSLPFGPLRYQGRASDLLISPLGDLDQVQQVTQVQHEGGGEPQAPFRPYGVRGEQADNSEAMISPLTVVRNQIMGVLKGIGVASEFGLRALAQVVFLVNELVPLLLSENFGISVAVVSGALPVGAGLGSSTAFTAALSAALFKLHNLLHTQEPADTTSALTSASPSPRVQQGQWLGVPPTTALDIIHHYVVLAESIVIDNDAPRSEIVDVDATISCYGGAVWSLKEDASAGGGVLTEPLANFPQFDVLLTNTGVPQSAEKFEASMDEFAADFPEVARGIFDAIGSISRQFRSMGAAVTDSSSLAPHNCAPLDHYDLLRLVRTHQQLLRALGVSNPTLEKICSITERYNAVTFLTGAEGGGYAATFLGNTSAAVPEEQNSILRAVETVSNNFRCIASSVGGTGVIWTEGLPCCSRSYSSDGGSAAQRQLDGEEVAAKKVVKSNETNTVLAVAATVSAVGACVANRMLTQKSD